MKAVWVDEGNDANYDLLRKHSIDRPYYDHRDPRVTAAYLDMVAAKGFRPGLYSVGSWYPQLSGKQYAEKLHVELIRIAWRGNPPVCVEMESQDLSYVAQFFRRWRELRPTRETDWVIGTWQGGRISTSFIQALTTAHVSVVVELYNGDMSPATHSPVIDLLMAGVPGGIIKGMYDGAHLPWRWNGYAFTQGRLPA